MLGVHAVFAFCPEFERKDLQLDLGLQMILTPGEQMQKGKALRDAPVLPSGYHFQQNNGVMTLLLLLWSHDTVVVLLLLVIVIIIFTPALLVSMS